MSYLQCEQIGARPAVSADQASVSPWATGTQVHRGNTSKTINNTICSGYFYHQMLYTLMNTSWCEAPKVFQPCSRPAEHVLEALQPARVNT